MSGLKNTWIHYPDDNIELKYYEGISFQRKTSDHYGVLCIQTVNTTIAQEPMLFHFQVDVSGSMSDTTNDGRTKMQLIIHTLTNMLHYFAENRNNIYVQVTGFDDKIHPYIEPVCVTTDNVNQLVAILSKMRPMNLTNIGMSIRKLCDDIETDIVNIPRNRRVGILLTDGEPTVGIQSPNELAGLVLKDISMSFIALGDDHSGDVMRALGHVSTMSSNWFVNKLEETGNVYGEIIFNELNRVSDRTVLHVNHGKIYDYVLGEFVEQLDIGILSSETCKYYHILTNNPNICEVDITCVSSTGDQYNYIASDMPPLILHEDIDVPLPTNEAFFIEKQWLRMYVQTLMSNARKLSSMSVIHHSRSNHNIIDNDNVFQTDSQNGENNVSSNTEICKEITLMLNYINEFIKMHNLENDIMINGLRDDLNVVQQTFGTIQFVKYAGIREDSQGRQYTCNMVSELPDNCDISRPTLTRSAVSAYTSPGRIDMMNTLSQDVYDSNSYTQTSINLSTTVLEILEQYNR